MTNVFVSLLVLIVGFILLMKGADFFVEGSSSIATRFHIPSLIIGLTIVAMGTSLPECAVSITASMDGNNALAVANAVGSNIFNILFIAGGVSLICPVPFESKFIVDMFVVIGSGCLLWLLTIYRHELNRIGGLLMLLSYVLYLIYLC